MTLLLLSLLLPQPQYLLQAVVETVLHYEVGTIMLL